VSCFDTLQAPTQNNCTCFDLIDLTLQAATCFYVRFNLLHPSSRRSSTHIHFSNRSRCASLHKTRQIKNDQFQDLLRATSTHTDCQGTTFRPTSTCLDPPQTTCTYVRRLRRTFAYFRHASKTWNCLDILGQTFTYLCTYATDADFVRPTFLQLQPTFRTAWTYVDVQAEVSWRKCPKEGVLHPCHLTSWQRNRISMSGTNRKIARCSRIRISCERKVQNVSPIRANRTGDFAVVVYS
jgi:hypothetical protein